MQRKTVCVAHAFVPPRLLDRATRAMRESRPRREQSGATVRCFATGILIVMLFSVGAMARAQETTPNPNFALIEPRLKTFFDTLATGSTQAAFQDLLAGGQLATQQPGAVTSLADKAALLPEQYGPFRAGAHERIEARQFGNDLILLRYLQKCEFYPIVWTFWFYRSPTASGVGTTPPSTSPVWRVVAVRFDNDLRILESSK